MNSVLKITIATLILGLSLSACNHHRTVEEYMSSGKALYKKGDYDKAKVEFKNVIQLNPKKDEAFYYLALIDEHDEYNNGFFENLNNVLSINPNHRLARLKIARFYLQYGQTENSLEQAEFLLKISPKDASALAIKSAVLMSKKNTKEAHHLLDQAFQLDPTNLDVIGLKVVLFSLQKNYPEALTLINKTLLLKPDELELYALKLKTNMDARNQAATEQDFLDIIRRFPQHLEFVFGLSRFYFDNKQVAKSEKLLKDTLTTHPDSLLAKLTWIDFLIQINSSQIVTTLKQFIEESPNEIEFIFRLVNIYHNNNQFAEAKQLLQNVLDNAPESKQGLKSRILLAGLSLQETNDYKAAEEQIEQVLKIDARHYEALMLKARLYVQKQSIDQAILIIRGILENYPNSDEALVLLGHIYRQRGDNALALETYYKALNINPLNLAAAKPIVENYLYDSHNKLPSDFNRADEIMQKIIAHQPNNLSALLLTGKVKLKQQDYTQLNEITRVIGMQNQGKGFALLLEGQALQKQGHCDTAIEKYKQAFAIDTNLISGLQSLSECYAELNQPEVLLAYIDSQIQVYPENANLVLFKSGLLISQQRWQDAMLTLNAGIKKWNNIREFYRLLSTVYIKIHDNDKLFDIYQRALKIWPNDLDFSVQLAQFYEEIKAYDKAKMIYEKILQQEPKHDVAANNLAALLLEQYYNQINAAKALELTRRFENSSNPYALDTYAWALFKNGKNVQALNFLKFVIAQEPKKAIFNYHLGVVYLKIQENKLALKFLETAIQLGQNDVDFDNTNHAQELLAELKRSIKH